MNSRHMIAILVFSLIVLPLTFISSCTPKVNAVKFLNLQSLSGSAAAWGWPCNYSGEIALEDINADGGVTVGGQNYKMEFVTYDNEFDPTITATLTRKGVLEDGCKYMHVLSYDQALAVADFAKSQKVMIFCSGAMEPDFLNKNPLIFQNYYNYYDSYSACLSYAIKKHPNYTKVATFQPESLMGHMIIDQAFQPVTAKLGLENVGIFYTPEEETDFSSLLTTLLRKGVDIIDFGAMGSPRQGYCIKQARELGFKGIFTHPDTLDYATVSDIAGVEQMEGNIVAPGNISMTTETGKKWEERAIAKAGSMQFWTSYYYDALRLLALSIEKANTFDPEDIAEVLPTVSYDGILGKVSFSETPHQIVSPMPVTEIINGQEVFQELFISGN